MFKFLLFFSKPTKQRKTKIVSPYTGKTTNLTDEMISVFLLFLTILCIDGVIIAMTAQVGDVLSLEADAKMQCPSGKYVSKSTQCESTKSPKDYYPCFKYECRIPLFTKKGKLY